MKTMIGMAAVMLLVGGVLLQHSTASAEPVQGTWSGEISSSHCGTMHTHGMTARDCTRQCVQGGAEYVLISNGDVYGFADQGAEQLHEHAGATVTVTGEVRGGTFTTFTIEARQ